jgi:tellurite resistance protein TerC
LEQAAATGVSVWFWVAFVAFLIVAIMIDLGVTKKKEEGLTFKDASVRVAIWVALAMIFGGWVWSHFGPQKGLEYFTGYIIELSLSMDNVFVIAIIFSYFAVPLKYQHRVLFWGILGALVMRGVMIWLGSELVKEYGWIIYAFGAFLLFTGVKLAMSKDEQYDPSKNPVVKLVKKYIPMTPDFRGNKFWVKEGGKWIATPLFLVLMLVEATDLVFAVDSIPAIFAVTLDPFIVFTANAFAILGLRSMYFMLAGLIHKFYYLKMGLSVLLIFVGIKMLLMHHYKIPTAISLTVIVMILGTAVVASMIRAKRLEKSSNALK